MLWRSKMELSDKDPIAEAENTPRMTSAVTDGGTSPVLAQGQTDELEARAAASTSPPPAPPDGTSAAGGVVGASPQDVASHPVGPEVTAAAEEVPGTVVPDPGVGCGLPQFTTM